MAPRPEQPGAPDPRTATPDEVLAYLKTLTDAEAASWVSANFSQMPAGYASDVQGRLLLEDEYRATSQAFEGASVSRSSTERQEELRSQIEDRLKEAGLTPEQAAGRADMYVKRIQQGAVGKDGDALLNYLDETVNSILEAVETEASAIQAGSVTADEVDADTASTLSDLRAGVPIPDLVRGYIGRGAVTTAAATELIRTWNEFNPFEPVSNVQELFRRINASPSDPMTAAVIDAAFNGTDPITTYEFTFGARDQFDTGNRLGGYRRTPEQQGSTTVRVSADQFEQLKAKYGDKFDRRDLRNMVYLANKLGVTDQSGDNAWQMVAALAAGIGWFDIDAEAVDTPPSTRPAAPTSPTPGNTTTTTTSRDQRMAMGRQRAMYNTLQNKVVQLKNGLAMYGNNDTMAFLHAMNPSLAARMATAKGGLVSGNDWDLANELMLKAGFDPASLASMGYYASNFEAFVMERQRMAGDGGGGGSGSYRTVPDQDAIRQSVKDLYRTMFAADPDDATLAKVAGAVTSAIMGSDIDGTDGTVQGVDGGAQIRKQLESLPEYGELYGNKPGGMTEAEYRMQFDQAAQSMLGAEAADPNAVRSGMRTGIYQTTVGAAATSKKAFDNSTFMGRLAAAMQVVSENT